MHESSRIADLLERVLTGDPWHGPSVATVLDGVTHTEAARKPPGAAHGIWELVVHMTGWTREVTTRLAGRAAQEPESGDWPPIGAPTAERWEAAKGALFEAHRELAAAIRKMDADTLTQPVTDYRDDALGTGLSHYVTLHGLVHHTLYHAGQIMILRRLGG